MLNGHKYVCPGCGQPLVELSVSFTEFASMDMKQRSSYQRRCRDEQQLKRLAAKRHHLRAAHGSGEG